MNDKTPFEKLKDLTKAVISVPKEKVTALEEKREKKKHKKKSDK